MQVEVVEVDIHQLALVVLEVLEVVVLAELIPLAVQLYQLLVRPTQEAEVVVVLQML
jgi:hypothetical protein